MSLPAVRPPVRTTPVGPAIRPGAVGTSAVEPPSRPRRRATPAPGRTAVVEPSSVADTRRTWNVATPVPAVLILGFGWVKSWSGRVLGGCCGREVSPLRHRGWEVRFCDGGSALPRRRSLIHRLHGGSRHPDRLLAPLLRGAA